MTITPIRPYQPPLNGIRLAGRLRTASRRGPGPPTHGQVRTDYDSVGSHSWYKNLEPTVAQVLAALGEHKLLIDYSNSTGILAKRARVNGRAPSPPGMVAHRLGCSGLLFEKLDLGYGKIWTAHGMVQGHDMDLHPVCSRVTGNGQRLRVG
jgi:hypothetical protein